MLSLSNQTTGGDGFYETFSDLIFGTMAIFVLLFSTIILLVRPNIEIEPPEPVDLVIALDTSGSMTSQLEELRVTLVELAENFPRLIEDFRIGFVAYQVDYPDGVNVFPLTTMDYYGVEKLRAYIEEINVVGGAVDTVRGLERAQQLFGDVTDSSRQRALVLIGDAGPYEWRFGNSSKGQQVRQSDHPRLERESFEIAQTFTSAAKENYIMAVYTASQGQIRQPQYDFFCRLAKAGGEQGRFTPTSNSLVWTLMESIIPQPTVFKNGVEIEENGREPQQFPC